MIPLHTFRTWKQAGYRVKKGERARIMTRLWKHTKVVKEKKDGREEGQETDQHYYLAKAFLFTFDQVEKERKE